MPRTIILKPFEGSCHDKKKSIYKQVKDSSEKIKQVLDGMKYGEDTLYKL